MKRPNALVLLVLCAIGAACHAAETPDEKIARLVKVMKEGQDDQRYEACQALGEMGPAARGAVPDILAGLRDRYWHSRSVASWVLMRIAPNDPAVMAGLKEAASDPVDEVRESVAGAFEDHAPRDVAKAQIPLLMQLLKDKNSYLAMSAASALRKLGPDAASALPELLELLKTNDADLRHRVAGILGCIGPQAKAAIPMLRTMLKSPDADDRRRAVVVLGEIGPAAAEAAPEMIAATADTEWTVRLRAALALGQIGQPASALPAFATPLKPENEEVRAVFDVAALQARMNIDREAMLTLLKTSYAGKVPHARIIAHQIVDDFDGSMGPALIAALQSKDVDIRAAAASALETMARLGRLRNDPQADKAVLALAAAMKDPAPEVRGRSALALLRFESPLALPALLEAMKSSDWDTRSDAVAALPGLRYDAQAAPVAIAALREALNDKEPWVRKGAIRSLQAFGPAAAEAVPRLIELMRDHAATKVPEIQTKRPLSDEEKAFLEMMRTVSTDGQVCDGVAATLGAIGPDARAAVPMLIELAKGKDRSAIRALGSIGPDAAAAVPVLTALLHDEILKHYANKSLARIGGPGAEALVDALTDDKTQSAAREALQRGGRGVVPALAAGLKNGNIQAWGILDSIGPIAYEAAPAVLACVKNDLTAAAALATLKIFGPAATPALIAALADPSAKVRLVASQALKNVGPAGKPALPALQNLVRKDEDQEVRQAAMEALRAIGPQ